MEINLQVNADEVKVWWQDSIPGSAQSRPYSVSAGALEQCSADVRSALQALNEYSRTNPFLLETRDPEWQGYKTVIRTLRLHGSLLRAALFDGAQHPGRVLVLEQRLSQVFAQSKSQVLPRELVTFHCGDRATTIPIGFIFEGDLRAPVCVPINDEAGKPCKADFDGFWINQMEFGIRLGGSTCQTNNPLISTDFRAVYALNKKETSIVLGALKKNGLESECDQFQRLTRIPERDHYDWDNVRGACREIENKHAVFFVFAHHETGILSLSDTDAVIWSSFANIVGRRGAGSVGLIIYNCCSSAVGTQGGTLLSAGAQNGFCGLVGTEAEIHNFGALRCGIRLMWNMCNEGMTLGEAFDDMQNATDLFPINLLYTCYAARNFRLATKINFAEAGIAA